MQSPCLQAQGAGWAGLASPRPWLNSWFQSLLLPQASLGAGLRDPEKGGREGGGREAVWISDTF